MRNQEHAVLRTYDFGPLRRFWGGIKLADINDNNTLLPVFADLAPANKSGQLLSPVLAQYFIEKTIKYCRDVVALRQAGKAQGWPPRAIASKVDESALALLLARLAKAPVNVKLIARLATYLHKADDKELSGLRPKPLAAA